MVGTSSRPATASSAQAQADQPHDAPTEGNQYASKTELLGWINGLLQLQLSRLEQFASGAVFCQLLDAYFGEAVINMSKVNFHASTEYEAHFNYKVLQTGFTAIHLTREIHVSKLARGSRTELLELLQYLFKYLLKLKALANYNARERRALAVRGGTDAVAMPAWLSGSHAAGRGGGSMNRSSGNWGVVLEPQDKRSPQLRTSTSSSPARAAAMTRSSSNTAKGAASGPCSPAKDDKGASAQPGAAAPSGSPGAGTAGGAGGKPAGAPEEAGEDEAGVAIFQVVEQEGEQEEATASSARMSVDEPGTVTRLVIPDEHICSSMVRPLSPGGRAQLEVCLAAAQEGVRVLGQACASMAQIAAGPAAESCAASCVLMGKVRSLLDAAAMAGGHVALLLADAVAVCGTKTEASAAGVRAAAQALQRELAGVEVQRGAAAHALQAALASAGGAAAQSPHAGPRAHAQLSQEQRQLASTAALDGALRTVGTAYAALGALSLREGAAVAARFFVQHEEPAPEALSAPCSAGAGRGSGDAPSTGAPAPPQSKVLRLSDCSMKRLRNGDVYRGRYLGVRKNGEGAYCFINSDVYEGDFRDDRMAGSGVYSFTPEGRYEGSWSNALYEGLGSETFAKGSTYHGHYRGGLRDGWGACRFFNGDYFEGQFARGLRHGSGMQQCTDNSNYCGQYAGGKRHGYGVYSFSNGDAYFGEYAEDIPQGHGVYVFASGQRYEGHWDKGKKHGWSIYTVETGQRWAGSWVEGKPSWVHPLPAEEQGQEQPEGPAAAAGGQGSAGAGVAPEVADNLAAAQAACRSAQQACAVAQGKLAAHWAPDGEVQRELAAATAGAASAAAAAQAARGRARALAARLNAAAWLIEGGSRGAQMQLASTLAQQLGGLGVAGP